MTIWDKELVLMDELNRAVLDPGAASRVPLDFALISGPFESLLMSHSYYHF